MGWILYIILTMGGNPTATTVRFNTQSECENHLAEVNKRFKGFGSNSYSYCKEINDVPMPRL